MGSFNKMLFLAFLLIITLPIVNAITFPIVQDVGASATTTRSYTILAGYTITTNQSNMDLVNITLAGGANPSTVYVMNITGHIICKFSSSTTTRCTLPYTGLYGVVAGNDGASYTNTYLSSVSWPRNRDVVIFNKLSYYTCGAYTIGTQCSATTNSTSYVENYRYITFNATVVPSAGTTLSLRVNNIVNDTTIRGFCVDIYNGTTTTRCNNTGYLIKYNVTGVYNISWYNISSNTYYNQSVQNYNFSAGVNLTANTSQSRLFVRTTKLFLNTLIQNFTITNDQVANNTNSYGLFIPANNASNNLMAGVTGNYTLNQSCTSPLLGNGNCTISGVYDNKFTIGANDGNSGILNFNASVVNVSLGLSNNSVTTSGSIIFNLLQGYKYYFEVVGAGYAIKNKTLQANASTNLYNFTLLTENTFNLTFYNESSDLQLTNKTVYVELISDNFANNYSTSNGTLEITLLTPDAYTIRYYYNPSVPREYYVTLTSQSYNNIRLYTIDEEISNLYLPVILDQNSKAIGGATVKLLRYFISSNSYRVVEMTTTDSNGEGVLRVVPNIINYKLQVSRAPYSFETVPTKFTSSTDSYTLNTQANPLQSITGILGVTKTLTFNNNTNTFMLSWSDSGNLVSGACLEVFRRTWGNSTREYYTCDTGASGSLIYTVASTNQTNYLAQGLINTSTTYSTYNVGTLEIDFSKFYENFGLTGVFLTLIVVIVFAFAGIGSTERTVMGGIFAIVLMSSFGFIFQDWSVLIGIIIVGVIIAYNTRTG